MAKALYWRHFKALFKNALFAALLAAPTASHAMPIAFCFDKDEQITKCPPRDERPPISGKAAKHNLTRSFEEMLYDKQVIDRRNNAFEAIYLPFWQSLNGTEQGYCVVETWNFSGTTGHPIAFPDQLQNPSYSYLLTTKAACDAEKELQRKLDPTYQPFQSNQKDVFECDAPYVDECVNAIRRYLKLLDLNENQFADKTKIEIVGISTDAPPIRQTRAIENLRSRLGLTSYMHVFVKDFQNLEGSSCARYKTLMTIVMICETDKGQLKVFPFQTFTD
jgi:hypothetical protein